MAKKFVFGETKVAKTSEEIREHSENTTLVVPSADAPTKKNDATMVSSGTEEKETVEVAPKAKTSSTWQEKSTQGDDVFVAQETNMTEKAVSAKKRKKTAPHERLETNGVKTENGIVVNVPLDDYMQLTMLKIRTSRTLKDLALQAIHEFVERNKM